MKTPPKIARWILSVTNRKRNRENVLGDFNEFYKDVLEAKGKKYATRWYWKQALKSIPEFILSSIYWGGTMLRNYLKVAFRGFKKQKLFTFINVLGLAIGITSCLLISLWVQNELSYDTFHKKSDRIFRIERELFRNGEYSRWPICSAKYKQALIDDFPEITDAARFWGREFLLKDQWNQRHRQVLYATDNSVFNIFDFGLIEGNPESALVQPRSIVLTRELALKYFRTTDVLGNTIEFELDGEFVDFKITGVIEKVPRNSHIQFDMLLSFSTYKEEDFTSWRSNYLYTYVLVDENVKRAELEDKLKIFVEEHLEPEYGDLMVQGLSIHDVLKVHLFPITGIHLNPSENWELEPGGSMQSVLLFSGIAFLLLIIAGINFTNLSTARANKRAKEVSLRKTIGADRNQLRIQFLNESLLLTIISSFIAVAILLAVIPGYNSVFSETLSIYSLLNNENLIVFVSIIIFIGLLAGFYPAVILSSFEPSEIIKGGFVKSGRKSVFRRNMVVFQFTISISLIIGMWVMFSQIEFILNKSTGFDKDNVVLIPVRGTNIVNNMEAFRNRLEDNSGIISVAASGDDPGDVVYSNGNLYNREKENQHVMTVFMTGDYDLISTYRIPLIAGRNFSREYGTDTAGTLILNREAVKQLGYVPEEVVGKVLDRGDAQFPRRIVGVIENFNFRSLRHEIEPLAIMLYPDYITSIAVRVAPGKIEESLAYIKDTWNSVFSNEQFEYSFLDKRIESLYESERKTNNIISTFTFLSIIIAVLGLFGLAAYTVEERLKEVAIKKTLGASFAILFVGLTKEFINWISISILLSWVVSYFLLNSWLENFAYRIEISFMAFLISALAAILITLLTVSYQTIKSSLVNPIDILKCE